MGDESRPGHVPVLVPVSKPVSLIPVAIKEAGLDSPTFRATATHFCDQVDAAERWLEGFARTTSRLAHEASALEPLISAFAGHCKASQQLSEAVIDHDYTVAALRRVAEGGAQEVWLRTLTSIRNTQATIADPIKQFLFNELRPFKDARRNLENAQKNFDSVLLRYAGQSKTKEPSSLREDAFQVHEARRAYLKASMDFSVLAPQLRLALDALLIKCTYDEWGQIRNQQQVCSGTLPKNAKEMDRIGSWNTDVAEGEKALRRQLLIARKQIEEDAEAAARPSRELDDYAVSTVPYLGSGPRPRQSSQGAAPTAPFKQGWLFLRSITGKPARTQWVRRWFFVKNGIFGCLIQGARSGGVEETEKIGVLLCGVRAAVQEERRFCFEIKTKDTSILLQAETQNELIDWMSAFEKAKQKAIEEPTMPELLASSGNPSADAAFAVSPAVAPELAAKTADGQTTSITEDPQSSFLSVESDLTPGIDSRHSVDVSQLRKAGADDGSRDHAARILQKLDIHRKTTAGSQLSGQATGTPIPSGGGIGSLIAASQNALAIGPGRGLVRSSSMTPAAPVWTPSMAPPTLVNLPVQTNLSKTALRLGMDKGLDLGVVDNTGGVPSSLMANQWGSANYGHISRHERGEVEKQPTTAPPTPSRRNSDPTDAVDNVADLPSPSKLNNLSSTPDGSKHRKTVSAESKAAIASASSDFPTFYPPPLRAHDSQFRMIFPNVPQSDRVVMVFRASWNPENSPHLPGRVFVTPSELFFYGNHLGMVVVHGAAFSDISEVSFEHVPGGDVMYLHMKENGGKEETLQLKVFLDLPKLLQRRLNYLISNYDSEEPDDLELLLQTLVRLENDVEQEPKFSESDELATTAVVRRASSRANNLQKAGVRVDKSFPLGGDAGRDDGDVARFRLPPQPVNYKPIGMTAFPFEKVFEVSAKALLHIIFGDKSAVCPIMNQQRGAQSIKQQPWIKLDDEGHYRRQFEYTVDMVSRLGITRHAVPVIDTQKIDVASDHLCYVVTETKVPWHLPRPQDFVLVSKVVITHEAKSRCKLAIFTRVDWLHEPWFSRGMIERSALDDMELDALNMADLVTEQVQRLGRAAPTRKILEIYGYIGQAVEVAQEISSDISPHGRPLRVAVRRRSMFGLLLETLRSFGESALTTVVMSAIGVLRVVGALLGAHGLLVLLLAASLSTTLWSTSEYAHSWWRDRSAAAFMRSCGVGPNPSVSRAVYLRDVVDAFGSAGPLTSLSTLRRDETGSVNGSASESNQCARAFQQVLAAADPDSAVAPPFEPGRGGASTRATARRLRRTRHRLATYRNDILVSLRMVNGIERETVQAEYDNWLVEEGAMCSQVGALLAPAANTTADDLLSRMGGSDAQHLRDWYEGYCASCAAERAGRLGPGMLTMGL